MWLLDNRVQSPSGSDMLLKIELLWQMFFRNLKKYSPR
jgi:hypothetical protein